MDHNIVFGRFRLRIRQRELLADNLPTGLGPRGIEILLALIERQGGLVTKSELLLRAWPGQIVDEHNLPVQVSALRKALGQDHGLIRTVARRGYRFVGHAEFDSAAAGLPDAPSAPPSEHAEDLISATGNVPAPRGALIGRETALAEIARKLADSRLITLAGPGGIGKTSIAVAAARNGAAADFPDGIWLCELAALATGDDLPAAVARTLDIALAPDLPAKRAIRDALQSRRMLIVLDHCEHLIAPVLDLAETILADCPGIALLATSREPLHVAGERVFIVPPLTVPDRATRIDPVTARDYSAVALFLERAAAAAPFRPLRLQDTPVIVDICRQLEGIPLAIELAAARMQVFSAPQIAEWLSDRFGLPTSASRTALPQRALEAMIGWSHDLLSPLERRLFTRLGSFAGSFELAAALAAGADLSPNEWALMDAVKALARKSMLIATEEHGRIRYGMYASIQAFARAGLTADTGEGAEC